MKVTHWMWLGIVVVGTIAYWPALDGQLLGWDDPEYVRENPVVAGGLSVASLIYAWTTYDSANWIPVTWMSYLVDCTLFGGVDPRGLHGMNIAWHLLNSVLVFVLFERLIGGRKRAFLIALLFAVHPLHVESVAWVSERKDLVSCAGLLLATLAYRAWVRQPSRWRYALVLLLFAFGLLAKSMLVTVPILWLLLDCWPLGRWNGSLFREQAGHPQRSLLQLGWEKWPLLGMSLADGLMTIQAQRVALAGTAQAGVYDRLRNTIHAYGWYVAKTFVPTDLCAFYPHHAAELPNNEVLLAGVLLAVITGYVWLVRRGPLVVGWLWFLISLLPVIGLLQVGSQAHADRYTYIPHLGLFLALISEVAALIGIAGQRFGPSVGQWLSRAGFVVALGLVAACVPMTRAQCRTWHDDETLWRHALAVDPWNSSANLHLGHLLYARGDLTEAKSALSRVLVMRPNSVEAIFDLGQVAQGEQQWTRAAAYYSWVLRLNPLDEAAASRLREVSRRAALPTPFVPSREAVDVLARGVEASARKDYEIGLQEFAAASKLAPKWTFPHELAAMCYEEMGERAAAERVYTELLQLDPHSVVAEHGLERLRSHP